MARSGKWAEPTIPAHSVRDGGGAVVSGGAIRHRRVVGCARRRVRRRKEAGMKKLGAEFFGTFWLVLGGCGSAVLAAKFMTPDGVHIGIGLLGVALAFGLTVMTM